eukprot:TRINITY_DN67774_c8_g3_i1.p1 TRINITY_DN67774_c8_g3~~TRINITY_DN67774_c8_g3_i1.p1  ORF type:complete len:1093 (+),score=753.79 TRINITY_DN67774_c8_g3_i1:273-3281(+)
MPASVKRRREQEAARKRAEKLAAQQKAKERKERKNRPKPTGYATVKSVDSGDTIVVVGAAAPGQPAPTKSITLSGIQAPRYARSGKSQDEPWAWHAREFLREKLVGKRVWFQVQHVNENSGREYGVVKLDDEDVIAMVVKAGWASVKEGSKNKDGKVHPERQALLDLQEKAKSEEVGIWQKVRDPKSAVRKVNYKPNTRKLFSSLGGRAVPGTIEYVRDGSVMRCEIVPDETKPLHRSVILVQLAGVSCPRMPQPKNVYRERYERELKKNPNSKMTPPELVQPEPFAAAAVEFVEARLLQRKVNILVHSVDKLNNCFATIQHPAGNIAVELVKNGLAKVVDWSANIAGNRDELLAAQKAAQDLRLNIWRNWSAKKSDAAESKSNAASSDSSQSRFSAKVVQIVSGDTVVVEDNNGVQRRVVLSSVLAPRLGNSRRNVPDQPWSIEAREWMRKQLIGKRVTVVVDYSRPAPARAADRSPRQHVTLRQGKGASNNVAEQLLAAGLAEVIRHRPDEPRSADYERLLNAEEKAKAAKAGRWSGEKPKSHEITDLTDRSRETDKDEESQVRARQTSAKAKGFLPFLQKDKRLMGVVEHVYSAARMKVFVPKHNCMINFVLGGVRTPATTVRKPKGVKNEEDMTEEQKMHMKRDAENVKFGNMGTKFVRDMVQQHDVRLEIDTMDKGNNFIGTLHFRNSNLSLELLKKGYASVFTFSAEKSPYREALFNTMEKARKQKVGIWANWVPRPKVDKTAKAAEAKEEEFADDKMVPIIVTEVVDPNQFYVHLVGSKFTTLVQEKMAKYGENVPAAPADFAARKGEVLAGQFSDGAWYRVRVESRTPEGQYVCLFIDYGNRDELPLDKLRPITDKAVREIPSQAHVCSLAGIKVPGEPDYAELATATFQDAVFEKTVYGKVYVKDRDGKLHLTLHEEEGQVESLNAQLVAEGLARVVQRPLRRLVSLAKSYEKLQEQAKHNHYGVWEYGDVSDPEDDDDGGMSLGRPKRANKD